MHTYRSAAGAATLNGQVYVIGKLCSYPDSNLELWFQIHVLLWELVVFVFVCSWFWHGTLYSSYLCIIHYTD